MKHEDIETLCAFIDNELTETEKSRVEAHLQACDTCWDQRLRLEGISRSISELPDIFPTSEERRAINQAVSGALATKRPILLRWAWALGTVSAIAIAAVAVSQMLPQSRQASEEVAQFASAPTSFDTPEELRAAVVEDPEIAEKAGAWVVSDVGRLQDKMLESYPVAATAPQSSTSTGKAGDALTADRATTEMAVPTQGARDCMRFVLRSQDYPMLPINGRSVVYKNAAAWLLVFAFTTERRGDAPLDRIQIWVVNKINCSPIHYAYYKP